MTRVPDLTEAERSPRQKELAAEIGRTRDGAVAGPFAVWLRIPELADKANALDNALRLEGTLDRSLSELAILVVARSWSAQYEWYAHERTALGAGLAPEIVDAVRTGREPTFDREDQALAYRVAQELSASRVLADETYSAGERLFGLDKMIELVTTVGFYTLVAVVLNGFDVPVPGGERPLPPPAA